MYGTFCLILLAASRGELLGRGQWIPMGSGKILGAKPGHETPKDAVSGPRRCCGVRFQQTPGSRHSPTCSGPVAAHPLSFRA